MIQLDVRPQPPVKQWGDGWVVDEPRERRPEMVRERPAADRPVLRLALVAHELRGLAHGGVEQRGSLQLFEQLRHFRGAQGILHYDPAARVQQEELLRGALCRCCHHSRRVKLEVRAARSACTPSDVRPCT